MKIEYEATFPNINKDEIRQRLKTADAELVRPEFLQKRSTFNLPKGHEIKNGWLRVRDEQDKITMTLKVVKAGKIEEQKEITLKVDDYAQAEYFLQSIGCEKKSYQETKREIWMLEGVEICIDEWPFLEPYVEIEGNSQEAVKNISTKLGFDYFRALFCSVDVLYRMKYGMPEEEVDRIPLITFESKNPFLKGKL